MGRLERDSTKCFAVWKRIITQGGLAFETEYFRKKKAKMQARAQNYPKIVIEASKVKYTM